VQLPLDHGRHELEELAHRALAELREVVPAALRANLLLVGDLVLDAPGDEWRFFSAFSRRVCWASMRSASRRAGSFVASATDGIFSDRFPKTWRCSFSMVDWTALSCSMV
jgi:hypothetical protein